MAYVTYHQPRLSPPHLHHLSSRSPSVAPAHPPPPPPPPPPTAAAPLPSTPLPATLRVPMQTTLPDPSPVVGSGTTPSTAPATTTAANSTSAYHTRPQQQQKHHHHLQSSAGNHSSSTSTSANDAASDPHAHPDADQVFRKLLAMRITEKHQLTDPHSVADHALSPASSSPPRSNSDLVAKNAPVATAGLASSPGAAAVAAAAAAAAASSKLRSKFPNGTTSGVDTTSSGTTPNSTSTSATLHAAAAATTANSLAIPHHHTTSPPSASRPSSPPDLHHLNAFLTHSLPHHHPSAFAPTPTDNNDLAVAVNAAAALNHFPHQQTDFLHPQQQQQQQQQSHLQLEHPFVADPTLSQSSLSMLSPSSSSFFYQHQQNHLNPVGGAGGLAAEGSGIPGVDPLSHLLQQPTPVLYPSAVNVEQLASRGTPSPPPGMGLDLANYHQLTGNNPSSADRHHNNDNSFINNNSAHHYASARSSHINHQHNSNNSHHAPRIKNDLYKTEICRSFAETGGYCKYGSKCQFAHGEAELRPVRRHPRYKTKLCRNFSTTGTCPYDTRCRFIHAPADSVLLMNDNSNGSTGNSNNHKNSSRLGSAASSPPASVLRESLDLATQPFLSHHGIAAAGLNSTPQRSNGAIGYGGAASGNGVAAGTPSSDVAGVSLMGRPTSPAGYDPSLQVYHASSSSAFHPAADQLSQTRHSSQGFADPYLFAGTGGVTGAGPLEHNGAMSPRDMKAGGGFEAEAGAGLNDMSDPLAASVMAALQEAEDEDCGESGEGVKTKGDKGGKNVNKSDPAHIISQSHVKQQVVRSRLPVFRNMVARSEDA